MPQKEDYGNSHWKKVEWFSNVSSDSIKKLKMNITKQMDKK